MRAKIFSENFFAVSLLLRLLYMAYTFAWHLYCLQMSDGTILKWSDLCCLREIDNANELRLCPKLTNEHFELRFGKMSVPLAMQVLSHTIASAIFSYVEEGRLHDRTRETAAFVDTVDKLADRLNSVSLFTTASKSATTQDNLSEHLAELAAFQEWVNGWEFVDNRQTPPSIKSTLPFKKGLLVTLASFQRLLPSLIEDSQYPVVATRRFNQDIVENLFSSLRRDRGGFNDHPQALRAVQSLRIAASALILDQSRLGNCEETGDNLLLDIGE